MNILSNDASTMAAIARVKRGCRGARETEREGRGERERDVGRTKGARTD